MGAARSLSRGPETSTVTTKKILHFPSVFESCFVTMFFHDSLYKTALGAFVHSFVVVFVGVV